MCVCTVCVYGPDTGQILSRYKNCSLSSVVDYKIFDKNTAQAFTELFSNNCFDAKHF